MTKRQVICIEWIDASMFGTDAYRADEASDFDLVHAFTVGVLVKEDKEKITLAKDWFDGHDTFRGVSVYPKSGIKKIHRLKDFKKKD